MVMMEQQEGGKMVYKVDWRDEKEKERDGVNLLGLMFAVPPHVTHPSDKLLAYFQPAPRHFLTSARYPAAPLPGFLFVVSFSNFSLPFFLLCSSFPYFVFKRGVV